MIKWTLSELIRRGSISFDEDVEIPDSAFAGSTLINGVRDVHVSGKGILEGEERFYVDLKVSGTMLCPDAITSRQLEVPFESDGEETYSFSEELDEEDEDARVVTGDVVDLEPAVIDEILYVVPLQVTSASPDDYPKGDGWAVMSEEEFEKSQKEKTDPRLAKLKDFKQEDK